MNNVDINAADVEAMNRVALELQTAHKQLVKISEHITLVNEYIAKLQRMKWQYFLVGAAIGCLFTMMLYAIGGI